jgi:hypothetical protein
MSKAPAIYADQSLLVSNTAARRWGDREWNLAWPL